MRRKLQITVFCILIILTVSKNTTGQTVTEFDGEYATDLTVFEFELLSATDPGGWLGFYWSFNESSDTIRFEIGTSVFSEDHIDVFYDSVYKIPMEVYINGVELDVNADEIYFDYWESIFWSRILLPVEDGQYNVFDQLEDQNPADWDVKGNEVSFFTAESEYVYDYNTGIMQNWTSSITYEFVLSYIIPPATDSDDDGNFIDDLPVSSSIVFIGLSTVVLIRKLRYKITNKS